MASGTTLWGALGASDGVVKAAERTFESNQDQFAHSSGSSTLDNEKIHPVLSPNVDENIEASRPEVTVLARRLTGLSQQQSHGEYINPFHGSDNASLDPHSGKFNAREWVENLVGLVSRDPERYPLRTAGFSFRDLNVYGFGTPTDYQKTFGNYPLEIGTIFNAIVGRGKSKIDILRNFEGLVQAGEMLVVLGRPGSGCSTLLKTISGETSGFHVDPSSKLNYQGIPMETMHKDFRGECVYQAEVDVHFPQLTVGQTLAFAAEARTPSNRIPGVTRKQYAEHMRDVIMAVFGLSHTINTKVGNDFVRGVSGGERKRVSIAEAALGRSPLQCWDNSTRGLDSATALEFVKTLRISTSLAHSTAVVAVYQASQAIYDVWHDFSNWNVPANDYRSLTRSLYFMKVVKSISEIRTPAKNSSLTWAFIARNGQLLRTS
jgi:ATP-binding cassette, subfamily G (WHITE), member 2, PDR